MLRSPRTNSVRRARVAALVSVPLAMVATLLFMVPALTGGADAASLAAAVPVEGVPAFGIGAGQIGNSYSASPYGLAMDSKGDLFASDQANDRVTEYIPSSPTSYPSVGAVVAGLGGQGSGLNQLNGPTGVALDAKGDLFVSDSGNERVVEYAYNSSKGTNASSATVVAGTGTAGSGSNQLDYPEGIALDANGDLFVADYGNSRVEEFAYNSATGTYASKGTDVAGTGTMGSASNQLAYPTSVALNAAGNLFVADWANGRVMEYTYNSSTGTFSSSGTQVGGTLPSPGMPGWLTFDSSGDLYVSYGYLGYGGVVEFAYNSATATFSTTATQIASGDMVGPEAVVFNPSGDLFVAETSETSNPSQTVWDCVMEFTYNTATSSWNPPGTVMGQIGRTNGGISAIALDSHSDLFVSDGVSSGNNPAGLFEFPFNSSTGTYPVTGSLVSSGTAGSAARRLTAITTCSWVKAAGWSSSRTVPGVTRRAAQPCPGPPSWRR